MPTRWVLVRCSRCGQVNNLKWTAQRDCVWFRCAGYDCHRDLKWMIPLSILRQDRHGRWQVKRERAPRKFIDYQHPVEA